MIALIAAGAVFTSDPCTAPLPPPGTEFSGPVAHVIDGDSLCVATSTGLVEVRLRDVNAPELRQAGGPEARDRLLATALGRPVDCRVFARSYDRAVALCRLWDGRAPTAPEPRG